MRRIAILVTGALTLGTAVWVFLRYAPVPLPPAPTPPARSGPAAYHVVYRVEETTGAGSAVSTEMVWVRRPFDARVERRAGSPPGAGVQSATITNREFLWQLKKDGAVAAGFRRSPGAPSRDASPGAFEAAVEEEVARKLGPSELLGTRCTRYLYREPNPRRFRPPSTERVESCVTADGIVLREKWTVAGKLARLTEAVHVDLEPQIQPDTFFEGRVPTEAEAQLAAAQEVVQDRGLPRGALRPSPPKGFVRDRTASVSSSGGGSVTRQTFVDAYRRGLELVVVEQMGGGAAPPAWGPSEGIPIRLGRIPGRLVLFPDHAEVRSELEGREFRVSAPTPELAVYFARTLA